MSSNALSSPAAESTALDSPRILSRHRRIAVPSTAGWSYTLHVTLVIPITSLETTLRFATSYTYTFDTGAFTGRTIADHENERNGMLRMIEQYTTQFLGVDGHACVLRTMCEVAENPFHVDGLLGEAFNAMLLPSYFLEMLPELAEPDYVEAQRRGQEEGDCSAYHEQCPITLFQVGGLKYRANISKCRFRPGC